MVELIKLFLTLIPAIVSAAVAVTSLILAWKAKRNAKAAQANAKTDAEKAQADADLAAAELAMEQFAKQAISNAETAYKELDTVLKQQGKSAGAIKKKDVLAELRTYAIENGITLDVVAWSDKIDELVKFTKQVNAKN